MGFQFDKRSSERIAKEVRSHERRFRGQVPQMKFNPVGSGGGMQWGIASTSITARTASKVGKGTCQFYDIDPDTQDFNLLDEKIAIFNFWATDIKRDDIILIGECTGGLFVLGRECSESDEDVTEGA